MSATASAETTQQQTYHVWSRPEILLICAFVLAKLAVHFIFNRGYGYFRDELYYLACGQHLAWGYVDQPPLTPLIGRISRVLFGDSLSSIRLFPALAGGAKIALTAWFGRELGGRAWAIALAMAGSLTAAVYLGIDNILSTNFLEPLFWTGCAYIVIRIINGASPRLWLWFGLFAGLGVQNKHSMVFFGFGSVVGLLLTPLRREFTHKWIWLGALIAFLIALPNVIWEAQHHWATYELLSNISHSNKNVVNSPLEFIKQQVIIMNPATFPLWLAGLLWLIVARSGRRYAAIGIAYLVTLVEMIALHGKHYYLAPAYPMLFAAGGVALDGILRGRALALLKPALIAAMVTIAALIAPTTMPILSPERLPGYMKAIHFEPPKAETSHNGALPQLLADQFGWPEMVEQVARVYQHLPAEERAKAAIFAQDYGQAGAVDFFGPRYGLPHAISGHQNYFLWGAGAYNGDVLIVFDWPSDSNCHEFSSVQDFGQVHISHWAMPFEQQVHLYVCRGLMMPVSELWPQVKKWM
jgi:hypothetical protein